MNDERFGFGDRVRSRKRPEWGVGSVVKAENVAVNGNAAQRVSVRFPSVGVKTLNTTHADLQRVETPAPVLAKTDGGEGLQNWESISDGDWLAPLAQRKIEEHMIALPDDARDPFSSIRDRLTATAALYRFDRSGRGLIDWAVAQTGMDDPMTRFNRHELEQYFDRWAAERSTHLTRLLQEASDDKKLLREVLASAPPAAKSAVRRFTGLR